MGIFYFTKSVALIEDIPVSEEHKFENVAEFYAAADKGYTQVSMVIWQLSRHKNYQVLFLINDIRNIV